MTPVIHTLTDALNALSGTVGLVTLTLELRDGGERVVSGSYDDAKSQLQKLDQENFFPNVTAIQGRRDPAIPVGKPHRS